MSEEFEKMQEMQVMEQVISARAYALWEEEGRPDGRALAHWLAAERELQARTSEEPLQPMSARSTTKRATRARK
jgi:Protein of unknown function (DUF2934)